MKKFTAFVAALAMFGATATAQNNASADVQYVSDPSQGYLFNKFKDNWFITAEGGVNMYISHADYKMDFGKRLQPAFGLYAGKWFTPIFGARLGVNFLKCKGLSAVDTFGSTPEMMEGRYVQRFNEFGPVGDMMVNLTNWWCGYHPGRKYNAVVYGGAGGYFTFIRDYDKNKVQHGWKYGGDQILTVRAGLINSYQITPQVGLSLDLRWNGIAYHADDAGDGSNRTAQDIQAYLGVTYNFNKREWSAPVVPVCPEPENCDALRARLSAAEGRIADLEGQLNEALNRPVEKVEKAPVATIYYPINVYRLSKKDNLVLGAISNVMKDNPAKHYTLTGWADNYTGTEQFNARLRENRVKTVEKALLKLGVSASQLTVTTNGGNLVDLGEKYVSLDRAVTIDEN